MQLLPRLSPDHRTVEREVSAGRHLPYARHVDAATIETRDGLLMQFIKLRGLLFETADTDELNYRKRLRDAMLQAIGSSRFALYHHIVRRQIEPLTGGDYTDDFSRALDAAWRGRLATKRLYVNDLYLTLVRRPLQGRVGVLDRVSGVRALMPARISDDGARTFIEWPRDVDLPAVYQIDGEGREALVNGMFRDDRLVIDAVVQRLVFRIDDRVAHAVRRPAGARR